MKDTGFKTLQRSNVTETVHDRRVKKSKCPHCFTEAAPEWTERSPDGLSKCSQCGKESPNPAWIVFEQDAVVINTDTERYLEMVRDGSIVSYVRARDEEIRRLKQARVDLHDEVTELEAENKRLRAALFILDQIFFDAMETREIVQKQWDAHKASESDQEARQDSCPESPDNSSERKGT